MIYSADLESSICKEEKKVLIKTSNLIWSIRDAVKKNDRLGRTKFECHSICRALTLEITDGSIACMDGVYVTINVGEDKKLSLAQMNHSWLVTKWGNIIDPYPIGIMAMSAVLIANKGPLQSFVGSRYMPSEEVTRKISTRDTWRKAVVLRRMFRDEEMEGNN